MANKEKTPQNCRLGGVGGQAIIEGVMMKSKAHTAIAVRRMDNKKISVTRKGNSSIADKIKILKWPILRGVTNFIESLSQSFTTITEGTDMLGIDYEEENASKLDKWLEKHCGKWLITAISGVSMVFGVVLAAVLFIWLPTFLGGLLIQWLGDPVAVSAVGAATTDAEEAVRYLINNNEFLTGAIRSVFEGVLRIVIFIAYIWLTSLIPDMKRVYQYHGAEHKSIFCYEKGLELTVENVKKQSRFHPRCGTSFMFSMLLLSIFIGIVFLWPIQTVWLRTVLKFALLPLIVGLGYEFIRYAGRHDNRLIRLMAKPGLWMQLLTTREPDDSMMEVAITSLKCALPDEFPGFYEECLANAEEPQPTEEVLEEPETKEDNLET